MISSRIRTITIKVQVKMSKWESWHWCWRIRRACRVGKSVKMGAGDDYTSSDVLSSGQDVYPEIFMLCLVDTRNVTQQ